MGPRVSGSLGLPLPSPATSKTPPLAWDFVFAPFLFADAVFLLVS